MVNRAKVAALAAEFLGVATLTTLLLAISKSGVGFSYFIASGLGLATAVLALLVGQFSGAQFNPAVTLSLWTIRKISTIQAVAVIAAQLLGGLAAWRLYTYLVNQPLANVAPKSFDWRVLWAEAAGAMLIGFGYAVAKTRQKWGTNYAVVVGGSVFLGVLVASLGANGFVNPAIALGMRSWSIAYVAGPILGALVGANVYTYVFAPCDELAVAPVRKASVTRVVSKTTKKKK